MLFWRGLPMAEETSLLLVVDRARWLVLNWISRRTPSDCCNLVPRAWQ